MILPNSQSPSTRVRIFLERSYSSCMLCHMTRPRCPPKAVSASIGRWVAPNPEPYFSNRDFSVHHRMHLPRPACIFICAAGSLSFQFERKKKRLPSWSWWKLLRREGDGVVYSIRVPPTGYARADQACVCAWTHVTGSSNLRLVACLTADHHLPQRPFSIISSK